MKSKIYILILALSLTAFSSCSNGPQSYSVGQTAAATGLAGGAIGAGSGALVGMAISNGDVAASALLGAGIGVPVGLAAGAIYAATANQRVLNRNNSIIDRNRGEILKRQEEINQLRDELIMDSKLMDADETLRSDQYIGPTLGNPFR